MKARKPHDPGLPKPQYVIHPYRVTLLFLGKEWAGLDVECKVSDPEIEPHAHSVHSIDDELLSLSRRFGFGDLQPVELIDLEHQMAQKIHAVRDPAEDRAHDLVDLQLLWAADPELSELKRFCLRTFDFRRSQRWPPLPLRAMTGWDRAYEAARNETEVNGSRPVEADVASARRWLEDVIVSVDAAPPAPPMTAHVTPSTADTSQSAAP